MSYVMLDFSKLFFYYEPCSFLFIGRLGSSKFRIDNLLYVLLHNSIFRIYVSAFSLFFSYYIPNAFRYSNVVSEVVSVKMNFGFFYNIIRECMVLLGVLSKNLYNSLLSITRGWSIKLRFAGIGYRVYPMYNLLVLKLGYNHHLIYLLPYELRISVIGRKKRGIVLFSMSKLILASISRFIIRLRLPNVYTGKGIKLRGILFVRKGGKKSQF